jgi:magnesium chelatase family protein
MLAHVRTGSVVGIDAMLVRAEVALASALPAFTVVGLAQGSVREGRERVSAALRSSGFGLPSRRITVNLAPADVRKEGTAFDLPIAIGILAAAGGLPLDALRDLLFLGELGLDGTVHPVRGVLSIAMQARAEGVRGMVVAHANADEAAMVRGIDVFAVRGLSEVVEFLNGTARLDPWPADGAEGSRAEVGSTVVRGHGAGPGLDLSDVRGQGAAKRALEIAAAGAHNLLMVGPPGSGKTMLARRLPGLLPPLTSAESLEVARVHSVAGLLLSAGASVRRPFRAPHHSVSYAGMVGGGTPLRPGELSLAHHGVLFLDELPEYRRDALEVLRQPLEEGSVALARAGASVLFPARVLLVAAMNPCPCGRFGDGSDRCLCDPTIIARYRRRISGPLLDRIDLHVEVAALEVEDFGMDDLGMDDPEAKSRHDARCGGTKSRTVAKRVAAARTTQWHRFEDDHGVFANAHMTQAATQRCCRLTSAARALLRRATEHAGLSGRGFDRTLRVARTIADLSSREPIDEECLAEALQYRARTPR